MNPTQAKASKLGANSLSIVVILPKPSSSIALRVRLLILETANKQGFYFLSLCPVPPPAACVVMEWNIQIERKPIQQCGSCDEKDILGTQ